MKIKKVVDICKDSNILVLIKQNDIQWMGSDHALYPLYDMPELDPESVLIAYDVPENKRKKMALRYKDAGELHLCLDDICQESRCEWMNIGVIADGAELLPVETATGMRYIDRSFALPLADAEEDIEIYERYTESGQLYFALKVGLIVKGIVTEFRPRKLMADKLDRLASGTRDAITYDERAEIAAGRALME